MYIAPSGSKTYSGIAATRQKLIISIFFLGLQQELTLKPPSVMLDYKQLSQTDFAQEIRRRPSMFFGKDVTLTKLENILYGFSLNSKSETGIPFGYFNYWVKFKLNTFGPMSSWSYAILKFCNNDETSAFWKFYELLDEFAALKPQRLLTADLTSDNLSHYYSENNTNKRHRLLGERWVLEAAPYHVKLFAFDYCIHAYHFDYFWVVGEYQENTYYHHIDSLSKAKRWYKEMFGPMKWLPADDNVIEEEFMKVVGTCRNEGNYWI